MYPKIELIISKLLLSFDSKSWLQGIDFSKCIKPSLFNWIWRKSIAYLFFKIDRTRIKSKVWFLLGFTFFFFHSFVKALGERLRTWSRSSPLGNTVGAGIWSTFGIPTVKGTSDYEWHSKLEQKVQFSYGKKRWPPFYVVRSWPV